MLRMDTYSSILITGGGGMLAHALKRQLARRGLEPVLVSRADLDVGDPAAVDVAFERHRPTLVLNCAAYTKVDDCEKHEDLANAVNGRGPENLAAACAKAGAKLVHYSTDFVFDGGGTEPYPTDAPTEPISAYGRSKLLGERAVAAQKGLDYLILRTAWLYGPGGNCFPKTMVTLARAGKPLKVVADQTGSPTFTLDLADATLGLTDAGATGTFHVTNAGRTTWFEFTAAILEAFDASTDLTKTTSAAWAQQRPEAAPRPAFSVLDLSKTESALGRPMRPWREALRDYRDLTAGDP